MRELIEQVGIKGCGGESGGVDALCQAGQQHRVGIMAMLTEAGVVDTGEALAAAASAGREESVKFLLQQHRQRQRRTGRNSTRGADAYVNRSRDMLGRTPLRSTIDSGGRLCSPRIVRLLIDTGADTTSFNTFTYSGLAGLPEDTPLDLTTRKLREKKVGGQAATADQLRRLEGIRRLLLQEEAIHATSWVWPKGRFPISRESQSTGSRSRRSGAQLRIFLPIMRRRTRGRRVFLEPLLR